MINALITTATGWLPAVTTLLGFATASILDWLKDSRAHKRERESRDAIRRDTSIQRQNEFQRQTLLDLQRAVQKVMRSAGEIHQIDSLSARAGLPWRKQPYPEDVNTRAHEAGVETVILGVRVLDDKIRNLLQDFKKMEGTVIFAANESDGRDRLMLASDLFVALNTRIGEVLRSLEELTYIKS